MSSRAAQREVGRAWDREYVRGRYRGERPVAFAADVLAAARSHGIEDGLYVGCGNGRNFLALAEGGVRLVGVDVSAEAIAQLAARAPEQRERLRVGTLDDVPPGRFGLVVGIQVFQHGSRAAAHEHVRRAQARVAPGGLMAVRVNAAATEPAHPHELRERGPADGFTARYLAGPKRGLDVRFFAREELSGLFADGFEPVRPLRLRTHRRRGRGGGSWAQWEGIWVRSADA